MGTGYTRNDTANNIADGNIINAADLDGEFDAIESAFNSSTGHTHDGTAAEGGAILVLGPTQEFVVSSTEAKPSSNAGLSLGTSLLQFNDLYVDGTAYIDGLGESILVDTNAKIQFRDTALFINSSVDGQLDIEADTTIELTAPTVSLTDNLKLKSDAAVLYFGADDDISITHVADTGLDLKNATGFDLNLQTSDTTVETGNLIGKITFNAPDEASGTDAILVGASIEAVAEATFDSATNSTALVFKTNTTGAATERMRLTSAGDLHFLDSRKAIFGAGSDLQIYHDGDHSYIYDNGVGNLKLKTNGAGVEILNSAGLQLAYFNNSSGEAVLKHINSGVTTTRLNTTSTGIDVTGTVTADGLTVDGAVQVNATVPSLVLEETDTVDINGQVAVVSGVTHIRTINDAGNSVTNRLSVSNSTGDISFYEDTGTTAKFFWDASAETLSIGAYNGAGTPSGSLFVDSNANNHAIYIEETGGGSESWQIGVNTDGDLGFYNSQSTTASITFDDSGNVGIGVTSPTSVAANYTTLHLDGSSGSGIHLTKTTSGTTATDGSHLFNAGGDFYLYHYESGNIVFSSGASATERMRIDSSGNVGIGTSSPSRHLSINSSGTTTLQITNDTVGTTTADGFQIKQYTSGAVQLWGYENSYMAFATNNSEAMRIDSSGNVGIGVTPSSWGSGNFVGLQLGKGGSIAGRGSVGTEDQVYVTANAHYDGTAWKYIANNYATNYYQDNSTHVWRYAASGTADNTITWSEAMRIDSSGNLLVGKTAASSSVAGAELRSHGGVLATRDGGWVGHFNRLTDDGEILKFLKDGATVGSIGSFSGVRPYFARTGKAGITIGGGNAIAPSTDSGAGYDNAVDLGESGARFRDLYLSGSIHGDVKFENNAGTTEYARFDSSGNLLVGTTTTTNLIGGTGNDGVILTPNHIEAARDGGAPLFLNRTTSDGTIAEFRKDGTTVGSIATYSSDLLLVTGGDCGIRLNYTAATGSDFVAPCRNTGALRDNAIDLGTASGRWDDVYATNALIQTSDRNEKQDIAELSDAEQRVAVAAKGLLRKFRWRDAVEEKGDEARTHFGIIAQDLQAAFAAEGLDAGDYAMFIHTTWTDEETGEERSRMGVRYSELLAFIIAAI